MSIAVFGASGFLGKHLLNSLPNSKGVSLRKIDWEGSLKEESVYINLIGKAHDHSKTASERDYYYANLDLLKLIYTVFIRSSASVFIHISSIAAIEEASSSVPLLESDIARPTSWYGKSKRAAEVWLSAQEVPEGKTVIILRPPMVHGAGDKGNLGLLYKFVSTGIPYPLYNFENRRSFISIANFCFFIKEIVQKHQILSSGVYHISDDEAVSTIDLIGVIERILGKKLFKLAIPKPIIEAIARAGDFIPMPLNSIRLKKITSDLLVSNRKIKAALNIDELPQKALEGLDETIRSFQRLQTP